MTTTAVRPPSPAGSPPRGRGLAPRRPRPSLLPVRRTLLALVASMLGVLPLKSLFSDWGWLLDAWITMAVVIAPAVVLRLRRAAGALDVWPGIILLGPWLTWRFVSAHAWGGVLPSGRTLDDVTTLMTALHNTTRHEVAPVHTTVAVRLVVCALLGLLAALVDLIAVVGRRGALAGVPLLVVFTVSGAVPRSPVAWPLFAVAAAAFLILLALDSGSDLESWGQRVHAPGVTRARTALAVSTQRIAAIAIAVAVVLPFLVPGKPRNLIAEAFHGGGSSGVGSFGPNGTSGGISPFALLKGELERPVPIELADIHVGPVGGPTPFYLRYNVLSHYTDAGWSEDSHGDTTRLEQTGFETDPPTGTVTSDSLQAQITISGLTGNAPLFSLPRQLSGLPSGTTWSSRDQLLLGPKIHRGDQYTERFEQAAPSVADLRASPPVSGLDRYTQGASSVPRLVKDLVAKITRGISSPYEKARALSDYFADPANGFAYTLKTPTGDSGSALVDFLKSREGFCQQYAAAMAIMLRVAGVPSRVVLGYMHDDPDYKGDFTITTSDAHAWVEAYFGGIGWIPFDTTPVTGLAGDAKSDLKWAPHSYGSSAAPSGSSSRVAPVSNKPLNSSTAKGPSTTATAASSTGPSSRVPVWIGLGILLALALALVPAGTRLLRRRRRYAAIRAGDADALWAELTDTAVDLGYVWSRARTPRQVAGWLGSDVTDLRALRSVTSAVERSRYSPGSANPAGEGATLVADLRDVSGDLRSTRTGSVRVRSILWPASLGWGGRIRLRRR